MYLEVNRAKQRQASTLMEADGRESLSRHLWDLCGLGHLKEGVPPAAFQIISLWQNDDRSVTMVAAGEVLCRDQTYPTPSEMVLGKCP